MKYINATAEGFSEYIKENNKGKVKMFTQRKWILFLSAHGMSGQRGHI